MNNAFSTFSTLMNEKFKDLLRKYVLIYLDSIIGFIKTREEHKAYHH